jgi:hypothetical protein
VQTFVAIVIHILEVAFLLGILGSGVVVMWVFVEDLMAVRASGEPKEAGKTLPSPQARSEQAI